MTASQYTIVEHFQLMETSDPALLELWMSQWRDIVDFDLRPVLNSKEAAEKIAPRL